MIPRGSIYRDYRDSLPHVLPPYYHFYNRDGRSYLYGRTGDRCATITTPFCCRNTTGATVRHLGFRKGSFITHALTRSVTGAMGRRCNRGGFSVVAFIPFSGSRGRSERFGRDRLLTGQLNRRLYLPYQRVLMGLCSIPHRRALPKAGQHNGMFNVFTATRRFSCLSNGAVLLTSSVGAANSALSRYTGVLGVTNTGRIYTMATTVTGGVWR